MFLKCHIGEIDTEISSFFFQWAVSDCDCILSFSESKIYLDLDNDKLLVKTNPPNGQEVISVWNRDLYM